MSLKFTFALMLFTLFASTARAQTPDKDTDYTGANVLYEVGFDLGNLLPNQIGGVTQIMGLGEVRGGFRFAPMTFAEAGVIMGNGDGVQWKEAHVDARMDIPVENLVGMAYVGADSIYYTGADNLTHLVFGGHVGGGIQVAVAGDVWVRGDMKFGLSPGNSLYIGLGLVFRWGGS